MEEEGVEEGEEEKKEEGLPESNREKKDEPGRLPLEAEGWPISIELAKDEA